ncbi:PDZ domain-containing protein [Gimesia aquarii]|uniref:Serine endoprotease n=1 Tax=Gimesia aquarii TaxID=2527964 RepID=A0A517W4I1_9PLAN|nr:PDZ domain-containing protein [Gimesia aquarii]QDU00167.1 serine endoprotease [Gimesia aquarii]
MLTRVNLIAGCALITASILHCEVSNAKDAEKTTKLPQQAIEYILDLESDDFKTREKATRALPEYGEQVIEPLLKVTKGDSLEASVRAILIIERIYELGKKGSVGKAEDALDTLTKAANPSVAVRAEEAIDRHAGFREARAVREIRKLGGKVKLWTAEDIAQAPPSDNILPGQVRYLVLGAKWTGGEKGLRFIKRISRLEALYVIKGHPIPEPAIDDLHKALPGTHFQDRDSDAMLGISSGALSVNNDPCKVGSVTKGLAAQKAGIQSGDIITKFNNEEVEHFESLIDLIGKKEAGDTVDIELYRDGVLMTLKVTLSSWLDK